MQISKIEVVRLRGYDTTSEWKSFAAWYFALVKSYGSLPLATCKINFYTRGFH